MSRSHPIRTRSSRAVLTMIVGGLLVAVVAGLWAAGPAWAAPAVRDFESDPVGSVPSGCTTPADQASAAVSDRRAHRGEQSLMLAGSSTTQTTAISCPVASEGSIDLRFAVYPEAIENGFDISLLGSFTGKPGADLPVFQFRVKPDGSLFWFDGLGVDNLGWTQISAPGTVSAGAWKSIVLQVRSDHREARIYAAEDPGKAPSAESYVGAAGPVGVSPVAAVTGYQFSSVAGDGAELFFVDDVVVDSGADALPAPRDPTFGIGKPTIIDHTDDGFMQMPNTAVSVDREVGPDEVLVGYPVHGDATHDTGTALASSLDRGRSWAPADDRNPFPDEQSFYLSRLKNGDLLAVSYHTFMIKDSDGLQAEVPTARSSDGGRTWTHRAGRMTAPEAMRPISDGTSRPGHPLGGFVLVHKVVEDADGTLYQSGYGYYADDTKYRQIILASTDGGENWTVRGTVAVNPELSDHPRYEGFCEAAMARASDGSLVAVMRTGNYQSMYQSRSTDDGATWSEPKPVTAGPDQVPVTGVFPDLIMMDNGTLVLYVGRPGQAVLASVDGTGRSWGAPAMVDYLNSGNGTMLAIGRNHILTFGDRGADWTPNVPERKAVWAIRVTVRPGDPPR